MTVNASLDKKAERGRKIGLRKLRCFRRQGFALIEVLLALAILAGVTYATVATLGGFNRREALDKQAEIVLALLGKARTLTIASKEGAVYGVHFDERAAVLFKGSSYVSGASGNKTEQFENTVRVLSTALNAGGSDIRFQKLTGKTGDYGSVVLSMRADQTRTKTLIIYETGIAETN